MGSCERGWRTQPEAVSRSLEIAVVNGTTNAGNAGGAARRALITLDGSLTSSSPRQLPSNFNNCFEILRYGRPTKFENPQRLLRRRAAPSAAPAFVVFRWV